MGVGVYIGIASLLFTMFVGFATTMRSIGRLEQKFDLIWAWYLRETSSVREGGRRRFDPPPSWQHARTRRDDDDDSTTG